MISFDLNYLAVVASVVAMFFLGFAWYSDMLFAKPWRQLMGFGNLTPEQKAQMKTSMAPGIASSLIGDAVMAIVLANVLMWAGVESIGAAMGLAGVMWLGFMAPVGLMNTIYGRRPMKLFYIDYGYQLASLLVAALILAAMA